MQVVAQSKTFSYIFPKPSLAGMHVFGSEISPGNDLTPFKEKIRNLLALHIERRPSPNFTSSLGLLECSDEEHTKNYYRSVDFSRRIVDNNRVPDGTRQNACLDNLVGKSLLARF